jgi:uncharacterized membrane protein
VSAFTKATYVSLFTTVVVFLVYAVWIFQVLGVGYFTGPNELVRIGQSIGILILAGWAFHIVVVIGVMILDAKRTGKKLHEIIVDERDRQINYRSMFISMHVLCAGLFLAIGALAMGWAPFWVFNIIVLFYACANLTELSAKIFFIHRGINA